MSRMVQWTVCGAMAVAMASVIGAQEKAASSTAADVKTAVQIVTSIFQKMDVNKDRKVSTPELQDGLKAWYKDFDANGDGRVTSDEFIGPWFVTMDINKDGVVTLEEYLLFFVDKEAISDSIAACDKLDANGDGDLTGAEVVAYRKYTFAAADANGDGKITPDEIKAINTKQFQRLDANTNGVMTVEEMMAIIPITMPPKGETPKAGQPAK